MGRKNFNAYIKKQKEERKRKKREQKKLLKEERRSQATSGKLEDMTAFVDEDGNIISVPPEGSDEETPESDQSESANSKES